LIWLEVTEQQVRGFVWSDALLCVLNYVGGPFRMLSAVRFVPRPLRDAAYRLFARHRLAFAPASCALPSPQFRERFLSSP
jgi:predicted DCC family thiol-disulfide oxidoreductase YuxK